MVMDQFLPYFWFISSLFWAYLSLTASRSCICFSWRDILLP